MRDSADVNRANYGAKPFDAIESICGKCVTNLDRLGFQDTANFSLKEKTAIPLGMAADFVSLNFYLLSGFFNFEGGIGYSPSSS
jgi:hypothetical protein